MAVLGGSRPKPQPYEPVGLEDGFDTNILTNNSMFFAFEWYEREHFLEHRAGRGTNVAPVLVLWLDEDQFGDYPVRG